MKHRRKTNDILMKNLRKNIFGDGQKIDEKTLLLAVSGDTLALMNVVDAYQPYIKKLAKRRVQDENGNYWEYTDENVKRTLETTLIAAVMKFNPYV